VSFLVAVLCWLSDDGWQGAHKRERELLNQISTDRQQLREQMRAQIAAHGLAQIDVEQMDKILDNILDNWLAQSAKLESSDKDAIEGIITVIADLWKTVKEARSSDPANNAAFADLASIRSPAEIDSRLEQLANWRQSATKLLNQYQYLDVSLKSELVRRGVAPLKAADYERGAIKGVRLDMAVPIVNKQLDLASLVTKSFQLLSEEFGHWTMQNGKVLFEHPSAINAWNINARAIHELREELERLER
jgi:hypothetical protein